jgi:hypothetical protein
MLDSKMAAAHSPSALKALAPEAATALLLGMSSGGGLPLPSTWPDDELEVLAAGAIDALPLLSLAALAGGLLLAGAAAGEPLLLAGSGAAAAGLPLGATDGGAASGLPVLPPPRGESWPASYTHPAMAPQVGSATGPLVHPVGACTQANRKLTLPEHCLRVGCVGESQTARLSCLCRQHSNHASPAFKHMHKVASMAIHHATLRP